MRYALHLCMAWRSAHASPACWTAGVLLQPALCQSSVCFRCVAVLLCHLQFTRSTTKYWVHPSNILRLKLALTKQLPLLVYGTDDPVSSGDIAAAAVAAPELAVAAGSGAASHSSQQAHKVTSLVSSGEPAAGCWQCMRSGGVRTELVRSPKCVQVTVCTPCT